MVDVSSPPPPAIRSSLGLASWFLAKAAADRRRLTPAKLQQLLYLAQALFAATQSGRKLIPATFLAGADGPYEPTVADALARTIGDIEKQPQDKALEVMLAALWQQYGGLPAAALSRMIGGDGAWKAAFDQGLDSEIPVERMAEAYRAMLTRAAAPNAAPRPARAAAIEAAAEAKQVSRPPLEPTAAIRMTMDGRTVTRWAPKRRIDAPN